MAEALMDEIVEEILIRLPPDDPASLLRAATACRRWCRIVSAPGFRRRYAEHHRTAPLLGFMANVRYGGRNRARFVPTTTRFFPPRAEFTDRSALDARHGRVLLADAPWVPDLDIWLPVTDDLWALPELPHAHELQDAPWVPDLDIWNAAVLCAAAHGECDHVNCSRGPFLVVFVDANTELLRVRVYSSEEGAWRAPSYGPTSPLMGVDPLPPAHVGNMVWFVMDARRAALGYNLTTQSMTRVELPEDYCVFHGGLTTTGTGVLGLARIANSRILQWSMVGECEGDVEWRNGRVIDLSNLLPIRSISEDYIGFDHATEIFFIGALNGRSTFIIRDASNVTRVACGDGRTNGLVPFSRFYTPELQKYGVAPPYLDKC